MNKLLPIMLLTGFCSATLAALPHHAQAQDARAEEAKASDKKSRKSNKKEVVEQEGAADVQPVSPEALASTRNALPAPEVMPEPVAVASPSMNELLTQGGGVPVETVESDVGHGSAGAAGGGALALGFGLFLVGGGLGAGVMVARQKKKVGLGGMPAHHLKHVKSIRLSPKHQISLIEAQGKQLVVGITSAQMTLLASLDDPEEFELERALEAAAPSLPSSQPAQDWNNLFTSALKQRDARISSTPSPRKPEQAPKPIEQPVSEDLQGLPPVVVQHASVPLRAEAELEQADEAPSLLTETEDYTLEEADEPVEVPRHDGMFADHDAVHHPSPEEPSVATDSTRQRRRAHTRARRSRESDSMLIALAAMRDEASR